MACALSLRRSGYRVTIFEKEKELGGALRWGIPAYRLPRKVLHRETALVARAGVRLRLDTSLGRDVSLEEIRETFDAVYVACGAQGTRRLGIDHETAQGVFSGVDFLRLINTGVSTEIGRNVVVIGGGNVAIDSAVMAKKGGSPQVTLVCLEGRNEMPAYPEEVKQALLEGVIIRNAWGPRRILAEGGCVTGIELKKCTAVFDESGRFDPRYDDQVRTVLPADMLIIGIGQLPETQFLKGMKGIETTPDGWIVADPITLETGIPGVFSGGDIVTGPRTAIEAIEAGQRAAGSIDRYLSQKDEQGARSREAEQQVGLGS
jgi:NADPH-dependent glutamate synthase beta subunit-like oxidoreductase